VRKREAREKVKREVGGEEERRREKEREGEKKIFDTKNVGSWCRLCRGCAPSGSFLGSNWLSIKCLESM
jgi:hypothetical protein